MGSLAEAIDDAVGELSPLIRSVRRHLHSHPEPSREEYRSTLELARWLEADGIPYRLAPTGRGLVAGPELAPGTRVVAIRADIDALRVQEANDGLSYASTRPGVMHACGHDAHAAMALGAALALHRVGGGGDVPIAWRVIFQPAEETGEGAVEMIRAQAMEGVSAIVAMHVDPERLVGRVGQRRGVLTACSREIHVAIRGRGGHGARPHQCVDPIVAAVQFVSQVYQVVPRSMDPRDPSVVTFGMIHGGDAPNAIPDRVDLHGTIRTFSRAARERLDGAIHSVARAVSAATGAEVEPTILPGVDSVINDRSVNDELAAAAAEVVGPEGVEEIDLPSLGGEDFAAYQALAPAALMRLGVASSAPWPPLHSPRFDIDERALDLGARILARAVLRLSGRRCDDAGTPSIHAE